MTNFYHNNYGHSEILLMQIINICKHEHKRTDYYITAAWFSCENFHAMFGVLTGFCPAEQIVVCFWSSLIVYDYD